ncbi:MAG TPA: Gfo/Idh/MocA family oxidoreductase, partial [Chloroflexi bacterium]|nr:Gfo/Idh/MocA family oxidoreductase [Chloroflexota bacterium]
ETSKKIDAIECVALADVNPDAAKFRAEQYGIPKTYTPEELLADPEIEIIVSLTPNRLHGQVGKQIIQAGKHFYGEKPFTVYREESQDLLAEAAKAGLRTGGAPDTFFGCAWQTARKAIDDGLIGRPIAATAVLQGRRPPMRPGSPPPAWALSPTRATAPGAVSFFMTDGGKYGVTNTFDMGPYYATNLINLLGPAKSVIGMTTKAFDEITRGDRTVKVEAPTHVTGVIEFANGVLCQWLTTADVYGTGLPHIEIYGTEGSLRCPDPNVFPGEVYLRKPESPELILLDCTHQCYDSDSRGVGLADMAVAIKNGRPHRAAGEMQAHVVDILNALHESSDQGKRIELQTTCAQPAPLPTDLAPWTLPE